MKLKKSIAISQNGFIFNASRGDSFTTNPIGANILQLIQAGKSIGEIQSELIEKYEIDVATCEKDLIDFFQILSNHNLLET